MIPLGPILGVAGIAAATILVPMAVRGYNGMVVEREGLRIEVETGKVTAKYEKAIADKANEVRDREFKREAEHSAERVAMQEKLNERDEILRKQMLSDPAGASYGHFTDIYNGLCKIASVDNNEARETCLLDSRRSDPSGYSPLMAVTPDTFGEDGIITRLCEETGADEYCNYQFIAVDLGALKDLKGWMGDIDRYTRALRSQKRGMEKQMDVASNLDDIEIRQED